VWGTPHYPFRAARPHGGPRRPADPSGTTEGRIGIERLEHDPRRGVSPRTAKPSTVIGQPETIVPPGGAVKGRMPLPDGSQRYPQTGQGAGPLRA
jgi:hypothetical protein